MSVSKGNELLQELYERLKGVWKKKGKYKNCVFKQNEIKLLLKKIITEYENDTDIKEHNTANY